MIKKYWFKLCDDRTDRSPNEQVGSFEFVKTFDIKDSLIVWHKVEDGLPLQPNTGIIIGMSIHGFLRHIYWVFGKWFDARIQEEVSDIIHWAYIKPPKE